MRVRLLARFGHLGSMSIGSGTIAEQVVEITKSEIDSNYIEDSSYVESFVEDDDSELFVAVGGVDEFSIVKVEDSSRYGVDVVGYILGRSYLYEEYDEYLCTDLEDVLSETDYISRSEFPVYLLQSLAVRDDFQGNGIGSSLVAVAISDDSSHFPLFAGVWSRSDDERNVSIAENYSHHVATVEDYYPDDWDCSVCEGDCHCDSMFYAIKREDIY